MEASVDPSPSDEILAQRLARGDDAAFDELYRRYAAPLARHGARILRDAGAGEDVAQTALLRAYRSIRGGTTPNNVRAWLYTIAQRTAFDSRGRGELQYDPEQDGRSDRGYDVGSSRAELVAAIQALPERQRQAYLLRELRGLSMGEIGAELGLASPQVEQALFAARNKLATALAFGGELSCDEVRGLDKRGLDLGRRRALKAHLRGCPECRAEVGGRLGGWVSSVGVVSGLRNLASTFFGGGGGGLVAAKVGTAIAVGGLGLAAPIVAPKVIPLLRRHPETAAAAVAPTAFATTQLAHPVFAGAPSLAPAFAAMLTTAPPAATPATAGTTTTAAAAAGTTAQTTGSTSTDTTAAQAARVDPTAADSAPADAPADPGADPAADPTVDATTVPTDTTPADATSADTTPTDTTPTDTTPTDTTPTDTTPTDTAPADTTSADTAPADPPPAG